MALNTFRRWLMLLAVALPASYKAATNRRYPVVFVTDAGYGFPLVRAIERHISGHSTQMSESGLQLQSKVYEGEDHLTLPPRFVTDGLMWVLGTLPR